MSRLSDRLISGVLYVGHYIGRARRAIQDYGYIAGLFFGRVLGPDRYMTYRRLRFWIFALVAGVVLARLHYGVWLMGYVEVDPSAVSPGFSPAVNAPVEMALFALVRIPLAVLLAHTVKRTLFADFETEDHPVLSGLVYVGTILGVVFA